MEILKKCITPGHQKFQLCFQPWARIEGIRDSSRLKDIQKLFTQVERTTYEAVNILEELINVKDIKTLYQWFRFIFTCIYKYIQ